MILRAAAVFGAVCLGLPATAATYVLSGPISFRLDAPGFVTGNQVFAAEDFASCTALSGKCVRVEFEPRFVNTTDFDVLGITIRSSMMLPGAPPGTPPAEVDNTGYFYFAAGAFGAFGNYPEALGRSYTLSVQGAAAAIPEPASWALMILGFGIVGSACRQSRKVAAS
jgi:hypothetical protein